MIPPTFFSIVYYYTSTRTFEHESKESFFKDIVEAGVKPVWAHLFDRAGQQIATYGKVPKVQEAYTEKL